MSLDEAFAARMRSALAGAGAGAGSLREVKMFGGICFMLNGNMVAGASRRGLLVRVGKARHAEAVTRPGARPMEMSGRPMEGYIVVDPPPSDERALKDWLGLAVAFVKTLPTKNKATKPRRG